MGFEGFLVFVGRYLVAFNVFVVGFNGFSMFCMF